MLNGLRLRLTLLYVLAALLFTVVLGSGCYWLLDVYFRNTTDLALQHKMAHEFLRAGSAMPAELAIADQVWYSNRARLLPQRPATSGPEPRIQGRDDDFALEETFDGELAAIFTVQLDSQGRALPNATTMSAPPLDSNPQALAAAQAHGSDWRTIRLASGTRVRVLTYRLPAGGPVAAIQVVRALGDQDRVLRRVLQALLLVGASAVAIIGLGSWWLAGQSVRPAQQAWQRQQTFVANASHELRAPITLLRASAEIAQRHVPRSDADGQALLHDVLTECDHMSRLVEDLLTLSRLDARQPEQAREPIALAELLGDVQRQLGRLADERGIVVMVGSASGTVIANTAQLRQVLLIVCDNALRHTPTGGTITLLAYQQHQTATISIHDTGSGIAPEHLPHVFERFYRANSARPDGTSGAGLGLAIAQSIVHTHHGSIAITSQLGHGTQVTLTLPATAQRSYMQRLKHNH